MIDVVFPKLYPWQQEVFNGVTTDTVGIQHICLSRRQCGKSINAIAILLYFAFKDKSIGTCVEPTLSQCRRVFKQIISSVGGTDSPVLKYANATLLEIEFINGSQIIFKSAEQGDAALRGITVKHSVLVIDEAAFIPKDIFETLYPIVDALRCPVLMISTPQFEDGEFYDKFMLGLKGDRFTKSYDWSKYDTSALLSPERLEYYRQTMSPIKFRSEYLAEFITDKSFVFGDFTKCYGYSSKPPKYAGIDWATGKSEKDDYSCLVLMDEDCAVTDVKMFRVIDPMALVDQLAAIINTTPTLENVTVEENSLGEVYRSALKRKLSRPAILKSFLTTNESKRRIVEQLIKAFSEENIKIIEDARLKEQLQHYEIEQTPTGKITYNAQGGFNDDAVIALCLAYDAASKGKNKKGFQYGFG